MRTDNFDNIQTATALLLAFIVLIIVYILLDAYVTERKKRDERILEEGRELGIVEGRAEGMETGIELRIQQEKQEQHEARQALRAHIKSTPWSGENGSNCHYNASLLTYSGGK